MGIHLVVWAPFKGDIPGHAIREELLAVEASKMAAEVPDGLSPVAALGVVCRALPGWELYIRKNGGCRWYQGEDHGAEVDAKGVLSIDEKTDQDTANHIREKYALKVSMIPGSRFSTFVQREMRRRGGISANDAGAAVLIPDDQVQGLEGLSKAIRNMGGTLAVVPVQDASMFTNACLYGLIAEIETLNSKVKDSVAKAWSAARGNGRVKAFTKETLQRELGLLIVKTEFWERILELDASEEKALLNSHLKDVEDSFGAVSAYRASKKAASKKAEQLTPEDDAEDLADDDTDDVIELTATDSEEAAYIESKEP